MRWYQEGPVARAIAAARPWFTANATTLAMVLVAAYIYVLRQPTYITAAKMVAEDATVFFEGAFLSGPGSLFQAYNGQIFLFQRLVALGATILPISVQPAVYALAGMSVAVVSCCIALSSRWRLPVPLVARFVCVLALLGSPAVNDVYVSLLNTHWWLAIGLVLLGMLSDPLSRRMRLGEIAFTAVAALSGFAAVYAIPSLAVRAIRNRSRHSVVLLGVALAGSLIEVVCLMTSTRPLGTTPFQNPKMAVLGFVKRVLAGPTLGDTNLAVLWQYLLPNRWVWLLVIALVVALAVVWLRAPRLELAAILSTILIGWVLALGAVPDPGYLLAISGRYFLVSIAMLYVGLILSWPTGTMKRTMAGLACVLLATGILSDYHFAPLPDSTWASFAACMDSRATSCSTVIYPGWPMQLIPHGH